MFFSLLDTAATLRRLGSYSGSKASRSAGTTIFGALYPVGNDETVIALNMVGQAYAFVVNRDEDVQVRDELTIDGEKYTVRGIKPYKRVSIDAKKCYIEQSTNK